MELLVVISTVLAPAAVLLVLIKVRRRRREEISAMPEVPRILHGTSEETMLEYLETSELTYQDRRGALSDATDADGSLSLSTPVKSGSDDDAP